MQRNTLKRRLGNIEGLLFLPDQQALRIRRCGAKGETAVWDVTFWEGRVWGTESTPAWPKAKILSAFLGEGLWVFKILLPTLPNYVYQLLAKAPCPQEILLSSSSGYKLFLFGFWSSAAFLLLCSTSITCWGVLILQSDKPQPFSSSCLK